MGENEWAGLSHLPPYVIRTRHAQMVVVAIEHDAVLDRVAPRFIAKNVKRIQDDDTGKTSSNGLDDRPIRLLSTLDQIAGYAALFSNWPVVIDPS